MKKMYEQPELSGLDIMRGVMAGTIEDAPVSVPVRAVITGSVPDDPPTQRVRLYDPGRKHLQDTATKLTTTLHNQQHVSLGRLLELKLLVGALGEPLGVRLWKAHRG